MEKREARIRCTGCGAAFKVRIPVTDKALSFTCKKCGKVLKIRLKSAAPAPADYPPSSVDAGQVPGFETTQLPDVGEFHDRPGSGPLVKTFDDVEARHGRAISPRQAGVPDARWMILSGEDVKGPFTDDEILALINEREISPNTSLRLGERPWIKASQVPDFRAHFEGLGHMGRRASLTLDDLWDGDDQGTGKDLASVHDLSALLRYPFSGGAWQPLAIFAGLAFVLSVVISLDFIIGLPVSILGWILLYGYLGLLARRSAAFPDSAPPGWDFSKAAEMGKTGAAIFAVLLAYSLAPVALLLTLMIASFLNDMSMLGHLFMALTVIVFVGSVLVAPAGLVVLESSGRLGDALSPGKVVAVMRKGGQGYRMLALVSVSAGMACLVGSFAGMFLAEAPVAGFLLSGLIMAMIFSYAHFVWFHGVGRFLRTYKQIRSQTVAAMSSP